MGSCSLYQEVSIFIGMYRNIQHSVISASINKHRTKHRWIGSFISSLPQPNTLSLQIAQTNSKNKNLPYQVLTRKSHLRQNQQIQPFQLILPLLQYLIRPADIPLHIPDFRIEL